MADDGAVTGAGATFPKQLYLAWAAAYGQETGVKVTYEGVGSGAGVAKAEAGSVSFGASDKPVSPSDLASHGLAQFPTVVGGVVPVVRLDGVDPGDLVLDGATLAGLVTGRIASWDDPAIVRLNPDVRLPHLAVRPVHRSDASGTTFVFLDYLSKSSGRRVDAVVGQGVKGSDGMVAAIRSTPGAVGYVDYADARKATLSYASLVNRAGRVVQPTPSSFASASASADWASQSLVDAPGGASWPVTTATYVLLRHDAEGARAARFLDWGIRSGSSVAEDLDFVPLPPAQAKAASSELQSLSTRR